MEGKGKRSYLGSASLVVGAALVVGTFLYLVSRTLPAPEAVGAGWALRGLDGTELDVADTRGKVVFLNRWATWCPPCRAEMASIQRLYDRMKGEEDVVFILVSDEDPQTIRKFVEENGYTMPVYSPAGSEPQAFRTDAIPVTFIIGRDFKIALRHMGMKDWDDEGTVSLLRRLLAEAPPAAAAGPG